MVILMQQADQALPAKLCAIKVVLVSELVPAKQLAYAQAVLSPYYSHASLDFCRASQIGEVLHACDVTLKAGYNLSRCCTCRPCHASVRLILLNGSRTWSVVRFPQSRIRQIPFLGLAPCMQVEETAKSVLGMYQKAIASADLLPSDKEELSAQACTFADMCGSAAMQEAAERLHAARWASLHHHLHKC